MSPLSIPAEVAESSGNGIDESVMLSWLGERRPAFVAQSGGGGMGSGSTAEGMGRPSESIGERARVAGAAGAIPSALGGKRPPADGSAAAGGGDSPPCRSVCKYPPAPLRDPPASFAGVCKAG